MGPGVLASFVVGKSRTGSSYVLLSQNIAERAGLKCVSRLVRMGGDSVYVFLLIDEIQDYLSSSKTLESYVRLNYTTGKIVKRSPTPSSY